MSKARPRKPPSRAAARKRPARPRRARRPRAAAPTAVNSGLTIVGVGASAGGLEAFSQLLEALPADAGLAVIFVQHLAPHHESALPALLSSHSVLPVVQVSDGVTIAANHVYVIPPNVEMIVAGHTLELRPRAGDRTQYTPIDTFFTSLAAMPDARPIAVVLSGTASDGAVGVREIKAAGGFTIAQDPESAKYDGMPRAAIATGAIDLILPPARIGAQLARIARHPYPRWPWPAAPEEASVRDDQLKKIFDLLRPVSGVDFRHYKQPTIRRRLLRRMNLHRLTEIEPYIRLLRSNPQEVRGLFQDLLIHVTRFFREPESFAAIVDDVFPKLLEERDESRPIRVWVCGCATGEEAYSLAICLVEFLQQRQSEIRVQIFATDVSDTAIDHARAGNYPASIAADVSPERLRFFTRTDGSYRVNKLIRDMCVFARQDLTRDPPFSRLDLVMCRNVLIYLETALQRKLLALFHYALNPNGHLVLGHAESAGAQAGLFALVDKKHRIHRKKHATGPAPAPGVPAAHRSAPPRKRAAADTAADHGLQIEINRVVMDRYAPAGVVVDADLQIVQFRGQTGPYLEPSPGHASLSLLKMAREGLLFGLRAALHTARKLKAATRKEGLKVRAGKGWKSVAVEVVPLTAAGRPHYLVMFEEGAARASKEPASTAPRSARGKSARGAGDLERMQRELEASREYLRSIIQELEAANEELQSANEEILSSNEELQSTNEELDTAKEELQSTNEELNTVNDELHGRNEEMSRVNSDLVNLVGSVHIAIVIVGPDLRIRRFTPMAEKILNLIPADLDRSIGHINPNIDCPNLERLITESMESVSVVERDVQDRQGRWYSLRIRPYKNLDNKIDGAVVALFDVDILKRSEQHSQRAKTFAEMIVEDMSQPLAILQPDLKIRQANAAFAALFKLTAEETKGRVLADMGGSSWRLTAWLPAATAQPGTPLPAVEIPADRAGRWDKLTVSGRVVPSPEPAESSLVMLTVSVAE